MMKRPHADQVVGFMSGTKRLGGSGADEGDQVTGPPPFKSPGSPGLTGSARFMEAAGAPGSSSCALKEVYR